MEICSNAPKLSYKETVIQDKNTFNTSGYQVASSDIVQNVNIFCKDEKIESLKYFSHKIR